MGYDWINTKLRDSDLIFENSDVTIRARGNECGINIEINDTHISMSLDEFREMISEFLDVAREAQLKLDIHNL